MQRNGVEKGVVPATLWPVYVIPAVMLVIALAHLPYGYYQFLRLVVCGASGYLAFLAFSTRRRVCAAFLVANALLFNPLAPVHLTRSDWVPIDLMSAVLLVITGYEGEPYGDGESLPNAEAA
jgi:hypothetical protein